MSFLKQVRGVELQRLGLTAVVDETFTPPLSDATTIVQKLRSARPQFVLLLASNVPDTKLLLDKISEYGLGGGKLPLVGGGTNIGAPELAKLVGKDMLEGLLVEPVGLAGQGAGRTRGALRQAHRRAVDDAGRVHDVRATC